MLLMISLVLLLIIGVAAQLVLYRNPALRAKVTCAAIALIVGILIMRRTNIGTETLTITALNEKNNAAKGTELWLQSVTVEGEDVSRYPIEGTWYWLGDAMRWDPEASANVPAGVTRSIKIKIPVGWERVASFVTNEWKGKVSVGVDGYGEPVILDCYSEKGGTNHYKLPDSSRGALNKEIALKAISALMIGLVSGVGLYCAFIKRKPIGEFCVKHYSALIIAGLAIVMFACMRSVVDKCSLWGDELYTVNPSLEPTWYSALIKTISSDGNGVLFSLLTRAYMPFVHSTQQLLLLPEICMALAVFCLGILAKKVINGLGGIIAAAIASTMVFWLQNGNNLRAYPLMLIFAPLLVYLYLKRLEHNGKPQIILYGLCMFLCVATFYLTIFIPFVLFVYDVVLYIRKKISMQCIWSYIIGAGLFFPIGLFFIKHTPMTGRAGVAPTVSKVINLLKLMLANNNLLIMLFVFGTALLIVNILRKHSDFAPALCLAITAAFIALVAVYSEHVYQGLLDDRKWLPVAPFMIIIVSNTIAWIIDFFGKQISGGGNTV
jgi:hypothetical protein